MKNLFRKRPISLLSVGEGTEKGVAAKVAEKIGDRHKIVAVDLEKPVYKLPGGLVFKRQNAIHYLKSLRPNSVGTIRDDYFFNYSAFGTKPKFTADTELSRLPEDEAETHRNMAVYVGLVKRALVPGGKFLVTCSEFSQSRLIPLLESENFKVMYLRGPKEAEIRMHGSPYTKSKFEGGQKIFRVVAKNQ